jgi:REP element-mobilizing transposase RayT
MGRRLPQSERHAMLFIDVLRSYVAAHKFQVHDFVVMPDHLHLLVAVDSDMPIERAMQIHQRRILLRVEKGIRIRGRDLAAWVFRGAGCRRVKLLATSKMHCREPGEGRIGGFA